MYHWKIAVFLAWYANLTQQSALALLRGHLNKPQNRAQRQIKLAVMMLLTGLLTAAMIPTAYINLMAFSSKQWSPKQQGSGPWTAEQWSPGAAGDPACCFVDFPTANRMLELRREELANNVLVSKARKGQPRGLRNLKSFEDMVLSIVLLFSTFITRILKGSMRVSDFGHKRIRKALRSWSEGQIEWICGQDLRTLLEPNLDHDAKLSTFLKRHLLLKPLLALYLSGHAYTEFATSMMFEVCLPPRFH